MEQKQKLLWVDHDPTLYNSNYIGMFDLTKGMIMIGIILLHCINDYFNVLQYDGSGNLAVQLLLSLLTISRYGSVPMLFMICGYGIRRQSVKKSVKSNIKLFLIPYFCVIVAMLLCVVLKWCIAGGSLRWGLIHNVLPFFLGLHPGTHLLKGSFSQIGPVWFFFTYIFASIYLNWVLQEKQTWMQILILAVGTAAALMLIGSPLPFCLQQIAICAGFMYVGMQLKRGKIIQQKFPVYALLLVYLLCTFSTTLGGWAEIGNNIYLLGGADLITAYLAGIVLLWLHQKLDVLQGVLADGLRWVGRHMMWLCCIHTVSYLMGPWDTLAAYFEDSPLVGLLLEIVISFGYAFAACFLLEAVVKKLMYFRKKRRE